MMNVYMDDTRIGPFNDPDFLPDYEDWHDWVVVRGVENVKVLLSLGLVNHLSLDHDMGEDEHDELLPDGSELVNWMLKTGHLPKGEITIHSANHTAAENMRSKINSYRKVNGL